MARRCHVVFHTCLPFCINGLAWEVLLPPLGPAFRLLSGCQCTKCNRNVLDDRTNLLCCFAISCSSPPRSFHFRMQNTHAACRILLTCIPSSVDLHRSWNCLAIVCTTYKSEQGIYVFMPATLLWPTLRYCNGANTPVNCRFFLYFVYFVVLATDLCVTRQRTKRNRRKKKSQNFYLYLCVTLISHKLCWRCSHTRTRQGIGQGKANLTD